MFVRLSPAQATSIHGWGSKLKLTLSWKDIEDKHIQFDQLLTLGVQVQDLMVIQPNVEKWVSHAGCKPAHALHLLPLKANPFTDLHGDLADVICLKANSKQLKDMGVTYDQLVQNGMTPEIMRIMGLSLQSWIDLGFGSHHMQYLTDSQLSKVFNMTRHTLNGCFRSGEIRQSQP